MGLRQVGAGDDLRGARIADIDGGEVLWCALMGKPQDAAAVLGHLDRHALADPPKPVELVMRELPKIPNRRICHLSTPLSVHAQRAAFDNSCGGTRKRRLSYGTLDGDGI